MSKFLQFVEGADKAATYPVDKLISMTCDTDATLLLKFSPGSLGTGQAASLDTVTLTISSDQEQKVMTNIADAIAFSEQGLIVIADAVNSVYIDPDITACTITLDA
jgi:hypothetical protein